MSCHTAVVQELCVIVQQTPVCHKLGVGGMQMTNQYNIIKQINFYSPFIQFVEK